MNNIKINIPKVIDNQKLEDIFVTALEGGSNYWYWIKDREIDKVRRAVPKEECPEISVAIFKAIMEHDVEVYVHDIETQEILGYIRKSDMPYRLERLANDEKSNWALWNELTDNGDAISSDIIFQYLVMTEVVYG
jgi:hypothetical protein